MKTILTLLLLLIYSTAFSQVPDSVEAQLQSIEQYIEDNRSGLDSVDQRLTNIRSLLAEKEQRATAIREGDQIRVTFPPSEQIDVQFRRLDDNKVHSVQWMLRNWSPPPPDLDPQSGEYTFKPSPKHDWEITVGAGTWRGAGFVFDWSESYVVEKVVPETEEPAEKLDLFVGFWYDNRIPDTELKQLMTVGHAAESNVEPLKRIVEAGRRAIPYLNAEPDETEFELRRNIQFKIPWFEEIGLGNIACYNLKDEPIPKGFSKNQLEVMVDEIQSHLGEDVCATFSFTRHAATTKDLPDNLNYFWLNYYPFYKENAPDGYSQVWTYEEFADRADQFLDHIKEEYKENPDPAFDSPRIIISPQVFGTYDGAKGPPWRSPEPITAEWYFRYAQANPEIVGLMLWKYNNDKGDSPDWFGLEEIPALERAWVEEIEEWVEMPVN